MAVSKNKVVEKAKYDTGYLTGEAAKKRMAELREKWDIDYMLEREAGRIEGKKTGRKEEKKEIARKLLDKNMSIEEIIEITGLTKDEIERLKNS